MHKDDKGGHNTKLLQSGVVMTAIVVGVGSEVILKGNDDTYMCAEDCESIASDEELVQEKQKD